MNIQDFCCLGHCNLVTGVDTLIIVVTLAPQPKVYTLWLFAFFALFE